MIRQLRRHESTSLKGVRGMQVRVTQGRVWLTRDGDLKDYFLGAGDAMVLDSGGLVVLYGLSDASLRFHEPARAPGIWSGLLARISWIGEQA